MSTSNERGIGPVQLSWRYACPGERHQSLQRHSEGVYCQSCNRTFEHAIDLKHGVAIPPEELGG